MAVSASTCRSDVWEFYEKSDGKVTCKLCSKELVYRGGTSNLREHLNHIHKKEYHPSRRIANQRTIPNSFSSSVRASCSESRAKRITELIVEMIAIDMRPLRLVECHGFCQFMAFVEPGYRVSSATHISSLVTRLHIQMELKLKEKIALEAQSLSLTSDIWTSQANDAYITVSCHFISPEWKMNCYVLSTRGFPERHTGINISEAITEILTDFHISDEQVEAIVHDQGSNYELGVEILGQQHGWNDVKCAGH